MKKLLVVCVLVVGLCSVLYAEDIVDVSSSALPQTADTMRDQLVQTAHEFELMAKAADIDTLNVTYIPRGSLYDIALPANGYEFNALAGNAVLMITAFSHDKDELPLKRIYIRNASGDTDLRVIHERRMPMASELVRTVLGPYRMDYYVCVPYDDVCRPGMVLVDWNTGRTNYSVVELPVKLQLPFKPLAKEMLLLPDPQVMLYFLEREFGVTND